jgi:hypothetical protein
MARAALDSFMRANNTFCTFVVVVRRFSETGGSGAGALNAHGYRDLSEPSRNRASGTDQWPYTARLFERIPGENPHRRFAADRARALSAQA